MTKKRSEQTVKLIANCDRLSLSTIPQGYSRADIKSRKRIIGDFYAKWIAANPSKKVWNQSLNAFIHIKFQSINETKGQASISFESTKAVMQLTTLLEKAVVIEKKAAKSNDKNQKAFDQMVVMSYNGIRLLVGHQKSMDEYVQYCVSAKK